MKGVERVEATGFLKQLLDFEFVFTLHVLDTILPLLSMLPYLCSESRLM